VHNGNITSDWSDYIVQQKDFGCLESGWTHRLMCDIIAPNPLKNYTCCTGENCNSALGLTEIELESDRQDLLEFRLQLLFGLLGISMVIFILVIILWRKKVFVRAFKHSYCQIWNYQKKLDVDIFKTPRSIETDSGFSEVLLSPNTTVSMLPSEMTENSGSGAGPPALVQKTISRQITLLGIKGKGR
jgi:hypothetical protein